MPLDCVNQLSPLFVVFIIVPLFPAAHPVVDTKYVLNKLLPVGLV